MDLDVDRRAIAAVSAGGALGALARLAVSTSLSGSPWSTWLVNVTGCLLIGVLYTLVGRRMPRLFLGTGVLGGYTTFSTATVQVETAGLPYLAATLIGSLLAAWAGSLLAAWVASLLAARSGSSPAAQAGSSPAARAGRAPGDRR